MSSHIGFTLQQSDAAQVPVAQVPVRTSLRWLVPATQEEEAKSAPLPSILSHFGFGLQQSLAWHVAEAQVTPLGFDLRVFTPLAHDVNPLHVGFASQQSDATHVPVAHVTPVNVSFKWFVPPTQEEEAKLAPLPSMLLHVGFPSQQSDIAQVSVAHVPVRTSLR